MKKNRMLRLASALLILTLLTTSVIGGTFAKYVSTGSVSDTARVAKWGVEIKTSGTLYSDAYAVAKEKDDNSNLPATWVESDTSKALSVASQKTDDKTENIVAPGTKSYGEGLSFAISGKPEVAVTVSAKITAEDIYLKAGTYGVLVPAKISDEHSFTKAMNDYKDSVYVKSDEYKKQTSDSTFSNAGEYYILTNKIEVANDYYPVVYELEGETSGETNDKTAIAIAGKLAKKIDTNAKDDSATSYKTNYEVTSDTYAANTDLATSGPAFGDEKLTWEWPYETTDVNTKDKVNAQDTLLGDMIAARDTTGTPDYVIVDITTTGDVETVTALTISGDDGDYTVKKGTDVVANLNTKFEIELTVTQVD